ncbi:hypothetical protein BYT27DRAFT_7180989 [Phlegmacium glaucopus]|nr:hypothetical protein BYT27DRAFT_7180989 [Phlegmacium glaucopus]
MADFTGLSLANILGYIWTLVLAFFVRKPTSTRSDLPLDISKGSSRFEVQQTPRSSEYKEHSEKERFLRHPSLRSKRKGRQKDTNTETRSNRYRSLSIFPSGSSIPCLNSFVHRSRTGSTSIPVVIVTPSTPTRGVLPVADVLLPSLSSPLELADATKDSEPTHHLPINDNQSVAEDTGEVSLSLEKQVLIPPDIENGIPVVEFDSWTIFAGQAFLGGSEAAEPSFFLPESLQKITFEPIRCASHALSAVSDIFSDIPVWSSVEALGVEVPSYFTSTPPKRRRSAGTKLPDVENNYVEAIAPLELPRHHALNQHVEHIPYPDVFDLDMYYDATISLSKKLGTPGCALRNTHSLEDDLKGPLPCERLPPDGCRERSRIAISSVVSSSSPVTYHEPGNNVQQSPSTPRSILENISSSLSSSLPQSQQHNLSNPRYILPLDESTNTSFRTSPASATTSASSTLYSIEKSTTTRVKSQRESIRSVRALTDNRRSSSRHCPQQSRSSSDSETESGTGSMHALNARLREVCDSFSAPTFKEEIEIWEPISF